MTMSNGKEYDSDIDMRMGHNLDNNFVPCIMSIMPTPVQDLLNGYLLPVLLLFNYIFKIVLKFTFLSLLK